MRLPSKQTTGVYKMTDQLAAHLDPEEIDEFTPSNIKFPVVGIGASAGGLGALLRFFEQMPAANGMAFVVILHLSPTHESNAAEILQRATKMPVIQVSQRTAIQADHVYVIPPNHDLAMDDDHLQLTEPTRVSGKHVAIDLFFRTLAQVHKERAVAVVLSGTGSDGAAGLARVKERGGVTLVQAPEDADYDGMPKAAIATGMVDFVASVADMPQRLQGLWANARRIRLPADAAVVMHGTAEESLEAARLAEEALRDIMSLLRGYSKNDFRQYKRATVLRRIERRLQVNSLPDLPTYRDYLREHPEEAKPLLQDMLISVTNFFRDRNAFEALERIALPELLENRSNADGLRAWVAGCATGEEAYSVAIVLREQLDLQNSTSDLQVFATDIDERAISAGRSALYPESIMTDVSPLRLRQFFSKEHDKFRIVKKIREKVLFARHNLLRDPPFSRLDLICCRNLLIYLDREAQTRVLEMFRFALKPGGYLFLGMSEAADAAPNLFTVVDKKNRIYKVNPLTHSIRNFPLPMDVPRDSMVDILKIERIEPALPKSADLHRRLIDQVVAPSVLIDSHHEVLHLSEHVGKFLLASSGEPSRNLLSNIPPELRTELRTALFQAAQSGTRVVTRPIAVKRGSDQANIQLTVRYFGEPGSASGLTLVMFDEVAEPPDKARPESGDPSRQQLVTQFENEIRQLKDQLHETIQHAETSTEDLRASNEELQAINEELRSASEELETSKEELQSINEELTTVNYELKGKVDETSKVNDDLQNLITSTDIATVFIDRALRIKRFTPQAASIFNLIATDVNRSLLDITHKLDYESLAGDAAEMLKTLKLVERPVSSGDGKQYLARMRPYRTNDDRIDGAVLTFVDVTALRQAEEKVRAGEERLRIAALTTNDYAILTIDEAGFITSWNLGARRIFGYEEQEIVGQPFVNLFTAEDRAAGAGDDELRMARAAGRSLDERWNMRKDGTIFFCSGVVTRLEGKMGGYAKIARDMTDSKTRSTSRDEMLAREQEANELKDRFLAVLSHELKHPLNLIQVNAELLVSQPEVRGLPLAIRTGEAIRLAVASQTKIIDDLLDLSRVKTGKLMLELRAEDIDEIASAIVLAADDAASGKGLTLRYETAAQKVMAICDRVRTEQIFWNLINNAIKFTPAGGSVTVRLSREDGFAKFMVSDNGQGVSTDFLPKIFGLFVQENHQFSSENTGLGVGLTLVRDLAVAQGGRVLAESAGLNQGSCFTVWLPLAETPPLIDENLSPSSAKLKDLRILAVDDMAELLQPFALLLRLEGATVDTAIGGHEALRLLESAPYDLLISDIGMDGMDGYELIHEIRKRPGLRGLQAIALSGYGRQVDVNRALRSGFNAHLAKPATVAHICQTIAQLAVKNQA